MFVKSVSMGIATGVDQEKIMVLSICRVMITSQHSALDQKNFFIDLNSKQVKENILKEVNKGVTILDGLKISGFYGFKLEPVHGQIR